MSPAHLLQLSYYFSKICANGKFETFYSGQVANSDHSMEARNTA